MSRSDVDTIKTFRSWATNITKCSNPTFNSVISRLWSDPSAQKEVITVLKSITKIIKDRNGKESSSEYFAVLISILNIPTETKRAEAYLLKLLLLKAIPSTILKSKFAECTKTIINVLQNEQKKEEPDSSTLKSLITSLGCVISCQDNEAWAYESTRNVYRLLLTFLNHEKPALKKAAHESIIKTFTNSSNHSHPAAHQTVEYIVNQINKETGALSSFIVVKDRDCKSLLRLINILVSIIPYLNTSDLKQSVEGLLKIAKFNNSNVVKNIFSQFCLLFTMNLSESQLSFEITAKLITALHQLKPNFSPNMYQVYLECYQYWLKSIVFGCQHLVHLVQNAERMDVTVGHSLEWKVILGQYEKLIKVIYEAFIETSSEDLASFNASLIDAIFTNFQSDWTNDKLEQLSKDLFPQLCQNLANHLDIGHRHLWIHILDITVRLIRLWSGLFDSSREINPELIAFLNNLAVIRDGLVDGNCPLVSVEDDEEFSKSLTDSIDRVFIVCLESFGADLFIEKIVNFDNLILELESCKKLNFVRSWLPPLFNHFRPLVGCNLAFFRDEIIPRIERVCNFACKLGANKEHESRVDASKLVTLALDLAKQMWSLLPAMLSGEVPPIDWTVVSKGGLGKLLMQHLMKISPFRGVILRSLKRLIQHSKFSDEGKTVLKSGAKMIIQNLLTLYEENNVTICPDIQDRIRQTLVPYMRIVPCEYLDGPCKLAIEKFTSDTEKSVFLDILKIILPYSSQSIIKESFEKLQEFFNTPINILRKRVYRIIEEIFSCKSKNSLEFIKTTYLDWLINLSSREKCFFTDFIKSLCENAKMEASLRMPVSIKTLHFGNVKLTHLPWKSRIIILKSLLRVIRISNEDPSLQVEKIKEFTSVFLDEIIFCQYSSKNSVSRQKAVELVTLLLYTLVNRLPPRRNCSEVESKENDLLQIEDDLLTVRSMALSQATSALSLNDDADEMGSLIDARSTVSQRNVIYSFDDDAKLSNVIVLFIREKIFPNISFEDNGTIVSVMTLPYAYSLVNILLNQSIRITLTNFLNKMASFNMASEEETDNISIFVNLKSTLNDILKLTCKLTVMKNTTSVVLGLRLINVLLSLADHSMTIVDLLHPINIIHQSMQIPVRNYTKKLLVKIVRKFGATNVKLNIRPNLTKAITNIAKNIAKENKKSKEKLKPTNENKDDDVDDVISTRKSILSDVKSVLSGGTVISRRSALSIPRKIHIERIDELLKDGLEKTDAREKLNDLRKSSIQLGKQNTIRKKQNLADELVNLEIENGLSRKSRRRLQQLNNGEDSETDIDSEDSDSSFETEEKIKEKGGSNKNFYLYEDAIGSDVLDLADTNSLATSGVLAKNKLDVKRSLSTKHKFTTDELADLVESIPDPVSMAKKRKLTIKTNSRMLNKKLILDEDAVSEASLDNSDISVEDIPSEVDSDNGDLVVKRKIASNKPRGGIRRHEKKTPGSEYTTNKAHGDMKRKGKPDPYAYVPLGSADSVKLLKHSKKSRKVIAGKNKMNKKHKIL